MKKSLWAAAAALLIPAVSSWGAASVTVKQSGGGDFTTIQAAINSGASTITIIDSSYYVEDITIGNPSLIVGGPPVTLTSNQTGTNRPVITPKSGQVFPTTRRSNQLAGFGLFADNSVVSNLILEANPDLSPISGSVSVGALMIMATNVLVENCLFRIATNTTTTLGSASPLLFFGQQDIGGGGSNTANPGGPDCNGCLVRNCEFLGVSPDANPLEPIDVASAFDNGQGYLDEKSTGKGTGQGSGYLRMDHSSDGREVFVTIEGCWFHYDRDYGFFPSNFGTGAGSINVVIKKSRWDANGKFFVRGRGANVFVEDSIFTRSNQANNGDDENSAVAVNIQDGHSPASSVKNSLFVNCASANAQRAYYGGVNNHNSTNLMTVDHCTFVDCDSGVGAGRGGPGASLSISNSIFHQIGDNIPRAVDNIGITLTNGSPDLVGGLYPVWTNGLVNFNPSYKYAAVFNRFMVNAGSQIIINNCMVGSIDSEDSQPWDEALTNVIGCRLYAGFDTNFVGTGTVTRATPVFVNQDPDAPNAFQLTQGSPGQGLGANLAPVLEPKLVTTQVGNQLTISWAQPVWMQGYTLKSSPSLSSPVWSAVSGITNFGVAYSAQATIGAGNQYFAVMKTP